MAVGRGAFGTGLTRRGLLAGGASALAGMALAEAPARAPRPPLRAGPAATAAAPAGLGETRPTAREELEALVRERGLEGKVSVALVDMDDGREEAGFDADLALPPASTAKALTALYALEFLGPDHRFATRLLADGPVEGGRVGTLVLAGGGDPVLSTDQLAGLARALAAAGVREVGAFAVWGGALPQAREITPEQLPWVGYNPSLGGLNLNFNRVYFAWERAGDGSYRTRMEALGDSHRPDVRSAAIRVIDRSLPVYTYEPDGDRDVWTVARGQLGGSGSRWLPVRTPDLLAGEAFVGLANEQGIVLPAPRRLEAAPPDGVEIGRLESEPLEEILRGMLLHSTNVTAEVVGLAASVARGLAVASPAESAAAMNAWFEETTGARIGLVDHSGLGGTSRIAAREMVRAMARPEAMARLAPILKRIALTDASGEALTTPPGEVHAKTGTLNFATSLAGYVRTLHGTNLGFAYFSADVAARAEAADDEDEIPPGSRAFLARSRRLQQVLLQRWGRLSA